MLQETAKRCPAFSSVYLLIINCLYFFFGLLIIGLASWGIGQQKSDVVTSALPAGSLATLVCVGVGLVLVSIVGVLGVKFNYNACGRATLGIYATSLIILMIMEFAAAGVIISFSNKLDDQGAVSSWRDYGVSYLVNQSYANCCCNRFRCPNGTCWLPGNLLYPCDSLWSFQQFLAAYVEEKIVPVSVIAILIGFLQLFTAIAACCNQWKGRTAEEQKKIGGPLSYDGMYADGEGGGGYDDYVKTGNVRPGSAAASVGQGKDGATAPKSGTGPSKSAKK